MFWYWNHHVKIDINFIIAYNICILILGYSWSWSHQLFSHSKICPVYSWELCTVPNVKLEHFIKILKISERIQGAYSKIYLLSDCVWWWEIREL